MVLNLTIRNAKESDAVAIAQILKTLGWFAHLNSISDEESAAQIKQNIALCHADNSHCVYVAENAEGDVLGYVAVHWLPSLFLPTPEGYLSELFIHDAYRGQGIGKALLANVISEATNRGCSRLTLNNHKDRESYQRGFYCKQGWIERETVANFKFNLD